VTTSHPFIAAENPLAGVSVLEIDGEFCGYAGRLLFDLGATVTRLTFNSERADADAWTLHYGKLDVPIDVESDEDRLRLSALLAQSDIVIQSAGNGLMAELDPESVRMTNPGLIHVVLSPSGLEGPTAGWASTDLTRLAAGGLLWLGGYPDMEPVAPYGDQSTNATGLFAVVAALFGLIDKERRGVGHTIDVSSQEVITQGLETALAEFELTDTIRQRVGDIPREAATGIYPCADGHVSMVAGRLGTAQAWRRLREWLVETGTPGAEELWGEDWEKLSFRQRPESVLRFSEIFNAFAALRSKSDLYRDAQERSIALAPVNTPAEVLTDPQLAARGFFREIANQETGAVANVPSPPYRFGDRESPPVQAAEPTAPATP
jgi:benzylsuccinate CoA-transferase BbsE subunit